MYVWNRALYKNNNLVVCLSFTIWSVVIILIVQMFQTIVLPVTERIVEYVYRFQGPCVAVAPILLQNRTHTQSQLD